LTICEKPKESTSSRNFANYETLNDQKGRYGNTSKGGKSSERLVRKERRPGNKQKSRERKRKTKEAQAKEARE
jgi:hypothetical protein